METTQQMNINPLATVIIPVRNNEGFIQKCMQAVLANTYNPFELIVVDNASTDATPDLIKVFSQRDSRVQYLCEKKVSIGAARNTGIRMAKGDIILMTDSDCIVPSDWIEKLTAPIREEHEIFTMGGEYDLEQSHWSHMIQHANARHISQNRHGKYVRTFDAKNFAIRADFLRRFLFDDEIGRSEDLDFFVRTRDAVQIRYIPEVRVGHKHKSTLISWAWLSCRRGYWASKIYDKNKDLIPADMPTFAAMHNPQWLWFTYQVLSDFVQKEFTTTMFRYVSEIAWRAGVLYAKIFR